MGGCIALAPFSWPWARPPACPRSHQWRSGQSAETKKVKIDDEKKKKSSLTSFIVWKAAVTQSLKEEAVSAEAAFIW